MSFGGTFLGLGVNVVGESVLSMRWKWPFYLLAAYPVADYFLHIDPWGIIGQSWAKLLLIYLAVLAFRRRLDHGRVQRLPTHKLMVYICLLGVAYLALDAEYMTVAVAGYENDFLYILIALLLPYALTRDDVVPLLKLVAFTGLLMAIHGVYEYAVRAPIPPSWVNLGEHVRTRVYSLFGSPNILGSYLAFIVPIAAGLAYYETNRSERWFYALTAFLAAAALLFTYTRGAWVAFFVAILIFTWLVDKRMTLAVIGLTALGYFFVHSIHARVHEIVSPVYLEKALTSGRLARWEKAFDQMTYNPLFGAGLGRYGGAVASRFFGVIYVDNYYAKTLAETGLLGLFSYLTLVAVYLRDVWRVYRRTVDTRTRRLFAGVFCALIVLTLHALLENIFEVPTINMLYWMVGSLMFIYGANEEARHAAAGL